MELALAHLISQMCCKFTSSSPTFLLCNIVVSGRKKSPATGRHHLGHHTQYTRNTCIQIAHPHRWFIYAERLWANVYRLCEAAHNIYYPLQFYTLHVARQSSIYSHISHYICTVVLRNMHIYCIYIWLCHVYTYRLWLLYIYIHIRVI